MTEALGTTTARNMSRRGRAAAAGPGDDRGFTICTDASANGDVYASGYFYNNVNFAEDWGGTDEKASAGENDAFIIKIKP